MSTDITRPAFTRESLVAITNFDDALALAMSAAGVTSPAELPLASDVLGDGFALLEDKSALVGVPLVILEWTFHESDKGGAGSEFVTARVVTKDGGKYIVNDGGSGIAAQLRGFETDNGRVLPILVEKGFRRSDYIHPEHGAATTFYLDTAAA